MFIEEIVANIDARIAALQSDIQPLLDARKALRDSSALPTPPRSVASRRSRRQGARSPSRRQPLRSATPATERRSKVDPVPSGKLVTLLEGSDSLTATALATETGGDANQIRVLLKELADAGQVRETGERQATRWHLVTDEEHIAARAAEIEAHSNATRAAAVSRTRRRAARKN